MLSLFVPFNLWVFTERIDGSVVSHLHSLLFRPCAERLCRGRCGEYGDLFVEHDLDIVFVSY